MICTVPAFSVPLGVGSIEDGDLNAQLIQDLSVRDFEGRYGTGINVTQTEFGLESQFSSFKTLKDRLDKELKTYMSWCGVNMGFTTTRYWGNINRLPYAYHMPHVHSFSRGLFSGVYFPLSIKDFVQDDEHISVTETPNPGSLVLMDPLHAVKTGLAYSRDINRSKFFGVSMCIEPRASKFVVFPNYLQHMVTPTEEINKLRISIAFDIEMTG